ncbi:MAG: ATP-binding protein [Jatrophihabitantaceae bacterium]
MTETTTRPDGDVVQIAVPADTGYVATLRLTAASLAARCDLTIDDIEDLRLAVDEACSLLLPHSASPGVFSARFVLAAGELSVAVSIACADAEVHLDREGFAWTVLAALASSVAVDNENGRLAVTVTKRREAAQR